MQSTQQVLRALRHANPGVRLTEHRIRAAIRRGDVPTPPTFAGSYTWSGASVAELAAALGLRTPSGVDATGANR